MSTSSSDSRVAGGHFRRTLSLRLPVIFLPAALLLGCTGTIADASLGEGSEMASGGRSGGGGSAGPPTTPVTGKVCGSYPKAAPGPGPAPLRRLTRAEYNNTVADLLGDTSRPAGAFPDDQREPRGFDNEAELQIVTGQLTDDFFDAAQALAASAVGNTKIIPACSGSDEQGCAETFIDTFGKRVFRRPVPGANKTNLMGVYTRARAAGDTYSVAMRGVLSAMLQSPYFIYRVEFGNNGKGLTSWEMASRLSYFIWGTMPDSDLFAEAEADALRTPDQIKLQVVRMLGTGKTSGKTTAVVAGFHEQLLNLQRVDALTRDAKTYPNFDAVRANMKEETMLFVDRAFWGGDGSVSGLFSATTSFMTPELAKFLKFPNTSTMKPGFQSVPLDPAQRVGLLTQASLLSIYSKGSETLPPARGKFVADRILCAQIPDPPNDAQAMAPQRVEGSSTREWFTAIGESKSLCGSCHRLVDGIGFAFENFDPAGRWRTIDGGKPIDSSGSVFGGFIESGANVPVTGAVELSKAVGDTPAVKKCIAQGWMRFALGRPLVAQDERSLEQLYCSFEQSNFNMRDLLAGIAMTDSFSDRAEVTP